jgi:hypothetical protein
MRHRAHRKRVALGSLSHMTCTCCAFPVSTTNESDATRHTNSFYILLNTSAYSQHFLTSCLWSTTRSCSTVRNRTRLIPATSPEAFQTKLNRQAEPFLNGHIFLASTTSHISVAETLERRYYRSCCCHLKHNVALRRVQIAQLQ